MPALDSAISRHEVLVGDLNLHWLEAGAGDPVLLLHGWPTSSFLWRNIMPEMAKTNRVIALDLPGFGNSAKPLDATYNFDFHRTAIDGFLESQGIEKLGLCVHDLGGPVGLYWAIRNPARVSRLALLNTLVYPKPSWAVIAFVAAARTPLLRNYLVSRRGLRGAMKFGVHNRDKLTSEILDGYSSPFTSKAAGKALLKTACELNMGGFYKIARALPEFRIPVRLLYGENDRILPDVAHTMTKVKQDLPQAELTSLPNCGHFLQEDEPARIAAELSAFFGGQKAC